MEDENRKLDLLCKGRKFIFQDTTDGLRYLKEEMAKLQTLQKTNAIFRAKNL
jgi:hypothetical protein